MTSDERPAPESYHSPLMHSRTLSDVDEQAVSLLGWTQEYQQLSSGKYAGAVSSLVLPEVEMIIESANRPLHQKGEIPRETVVLAFALNAGGEGWLSGKKFDKNTMLVLADGNELDFRTPPNLTVAAVVVDAKVFARHLQAIDSAASFDTAIKNRFAAIEPSAVNRLHAYVRSVIRDIQSDEIDLAHPASISAFSEALINNFIHSLSGAYPANQAIPRSAPQHRTLVGKAVEYMRANLDQTISILDICAALNTEQRVLNYCFQEVLAISPISYLKYLRLNQVRRELKNADTLQCNIGDVATRWGFWHLSRFASEYRNLFGELPSDTVRRSNKSFKQ